METLRHLDRRTLALGGLVLVTVLFLAVNVFSNMTFRSWQLDLTEEKLFTLSDGTRSVLASIDEPIDVRLYYTKLLGERSPVHATYFARVRELLERYEDLSGGKVRLELRNPEPFSDTEDRAVAFGLQGIPVNAAGDLGYFGLAATNSTDDEGVIPYFSPEREAFLEYDLTRLIFSLANPKRKVVGLISSLPIDGGAAGPFAPARRWVVMDQIRELFIVRSLAADIKAIPDSVDILMLVHPKGLTEKALYAIDQFVLGGGRALVFVDPNAESEGMRGRRFGAPGGSEFNRILEAWGVRLVEDKVAGDLDTARRVNINQRGRVDVVDYVLWLSLAPGNFDTGDVVTGDVNRLNVATPGILEKVDGRGTEVSALLSLGPRSMRIDANKIRVGADAVALFRDFRPGGDELMLAARVTGPAKSA
ncbi:MAG: GldG family protein [Alphaproteobacteria bacterium]